MPLTLSNPTEDVADPFGDLVPDNVSPELIGGGTPGAPAFQSDPTGVDRFGRPSQFEEVPRAIEAPASNPEPEARGGATAFDAGPFTDLVRTTNPAAVTDYSQFGEFHDLVPRSITPQTDSVMADLQGQLDQEMHQRQDRLGNSGLYNLGLQMLNKVTGLPLSRPFEAGRHFFESDTPIIPSATRQQAEDFVDTPGFQVMFPSLQDPDMRARAVGAVLGASDVASGLSTRRNIGIMASMAGAPALIQTAIGLGFGVDAAHDIYDRSKALADIADPVERTRQMAAIVADAAIVAGGAFAAGHGIKEFRGVEKPPVQIEKPPIQLGGETNASSITSAEGIPQREVRPQLGESPSLRQPGEITGAQVVEPDVGAQPPSVAAPEEVAGPVEPISTTAPAEAKPPLAEEGGAIAPAEPVAGGEHVVSVAGRTFRGDTVEAALDNARKELAPEMTPPEFLSAARAEPDFEINPKPKPPPAAEPAPAAPKETDVERAIREAEAETPPTPEELQRMQTEMEQEQLGAFREHQAAGSNEILTQLEKVGGLPSPGHPERLARSRLQRRQKGSVTMDELDTVYSEAKTALKEGRITTKQFRRLFNKRASTHLDRTRESFEEAGFPFPLTDDLLAALSERFRSGKEQYGTQDSGVAQGLVPAGFGPGAQVQGELEARYGGRKPIRIANADIDAARRARGLEPVMSEARQENSVLWDRAMAKIDDMPEAPRMLVDNINEGRVKKTSDLDQAMLLHEELRIRNEKQMEAERAVDDHASEEERADARAKFDALEARLDQTERAARKAGTVAGRALQARQLAVYDDYTQAQLETRARNAAGRPLTVEESSKIKEQAAEIQKLRDELTKAQDKGSRDRATEILDRLVTDIGRETKAQIKSGKGILSILDDQAAAARTRSLERLKRGGAFSGIDPEAVLDATIIGASHIAHGIKNAVEWGNAMARDFGEKIRPYLDEIFVKAKEYHAAIEKSAGTKRKPKATPIEKIATAATEAKAGEGEGLTNRMVFDLARQHVQDGVEGLDNVMAAVTKDLEPYFPGLTVRETRDMFSDYGKVKFPSKAEDLVKLRDYRRQGQLVSALEDAQQKLSPKRTGQQRDKPSERVKELQKQVQAAMQDAGITTAGDPTRLKTNLDKFKANLDRRIADAERRIREKDYAKPKRTATVLDTEAINKQAALQSKLKVIDSELEKLRLQNRSGPEKFQDAIVKWKRAAILFSPRVFPKLIEAGLVRLVTNPITRVFSQPLRLIPGLAEKAPAQMGVSFKAEAKRVGAILSSPPEAFRKLIGKSKLDALSKKRILDNEMANVIGNAHGMIKEPVRQGEYAAAIEYYTKAALKQGLDIREPAVQTTIVANAVGDANWQIFQSDNLFSKHMSSIVLNSLRQSSETGAKSLANALQFLMPIVRVSSNIALQTARLQVGLPEAFIRIATAAKRGELANRAEGLSHSDAQAIARSFSSGLLGTILAAYAWQNPDDFGGIHGEYDVTHKHGKLKSDEIKFMGHTLPGWMNHAPEMQFLNTVASASRVYRHFYAKGTGVGNSLTEMMAFSLMAPVKNLPFIDTWLRFFNGNQSAGRTFGQTVRGAIVPGGDTILRMFDKADRNPKTFLDELKLAIPGLRQTVPVRGAGKTSAFPAP